MQRRHFLSLAPSAVSLGQTARTRPNVLFLFADDQRTDTISALGNPHIKTPNLDSLVRRGFTFRNAYCMGSNVGAVCLPSRNMLLSGRAYFRYGRFASGSDPNFPDSMRQAGYETYHHGKRGNSAQEIHKRFDHSRYEEDAARRDGEPGKTIADAAIDFIRGRRSDRPFFAYLGFSAPHDPRIAAQRYMDMYQRERIPLPANYLPLHPFDNGEQFVRDELLAAYPRSKEEIRKHLHDYYAVISALDGHVGRVLAAVPQNTIVIYSADHGLAMGSHGLMGKQSLYDHSMRSPLIFAGPGIRHGSSSALAYLMDIFPTAVELVGGAIPDGLDGRSLVPVMQERQKRVRDSVFLAYRDVQRAVRDERWKLIRYPQINRTQLFDLQRDRHEMRDLSAAPAQAKRIEKMLASMREWQARVGDNQVLTVAEPKDSALLPPTPEQLDAHKKKWRM